MSWQCVCSDAYSWKLRLAQAVPERSLDQFLAQAGMLVKWPKYSVWVDYDAEADVLYLSFEHPQDATNSRMRDDGVVLHYRGRKLVGVTIFEAFMRR